MLTSANNTISTHWLKTCYASVIRDRVLHIICSVLLVVLLAIAVSTFSNWHNDWLLAHQKLAEPGPALENSKDKDLVALLPDAHLFGQAMAKVGEVPTSNLQLQVTGIVKAGFGNKKVNSKAYISIAGQPSKIYQTGDMLPYGVKVYAITKDAVIVENNGHLEKLLLPREPLQFKERMATEEA